MLARPWHAFIAVVCAAAVLELCAAGCSERFEWRELRSDSGFAAMLPGRPQSVTRAIAIGSERATMTIWSSGDGPTIFAVGTAALPPALVHDEQVRNSTLGFFRDALVHNIGGSAPVPRTAPALPGSGTRKLLAAEEFEAAGRIGPDGRKSRLAARMFIVDDRFFQVVALGAEGEIPPAALDTFFSSFRLTP